MSAGICIMNKNAIALAADSAVTVGQHIAIHNSANKLFSLSRFEPIGAIIYANAEFMQIPMETIIKQYKSNLGTKSFASLNDYVSDFINYIESHKSLFHFENNEKAYVESVYIDLLNGMRGDYKNNIDAKIYQVSRELNDTELKKIYTDTFNSTLTFIEMQKKIENAHFAKYIKEEYFSDIKKYLRENFDWLTEEQTLQLSQKICDVYDTSFFRNGYVGVLFAGYGTDEIFPQMRHIHFSGIINGKIRYTNIETASINENCTANITPLAQTDVMQTFLFGINDGFINQIAYEVPSQITNRLATIDDACFAEGKKETVIQELTDSTKSIVEQIIKKANEDFMRPILHSVATLPIEELSLLAESMINITSVRRKVALDGNIGTVGGPIDTAIISKGDGFIWLKRKHYFDVKYNPQYLYTHYPQNNNYYEGDNKYEQTKSK